jgi:hypothetical protein
MPVREAGFRVHNLTICFPTHSSGLCFLILNAYNGAFDCRNTIATQWRIRKCRVALAVSIKGLANV